LGGGGWREALAGGVHRRVPFSGRFEKYILIAETRKG
jgi:hypothetical protein